MKEYGIPVIWSSWGIVRVKAESLEDAIDKAEYEGSLPREQGEYVYGSFQIDHESHVLGDFVNINEQQRGN